MKKYNIKQFRKKPVEIEAIQYTGHNDFYIEKCEFNLNNVKL